MEINQIQLTTFSRLLGMRILCVYLRVTDSMGIWLSWHSVRCSMQSGWFQGPGNDSGIWWLNVFESACESGWHMLSLSESV